MSDAEMITWQWLSYSQLTTDQLYEILALRQKVFVVEQQCPYLDADGLDQHSWHLLGLDESGALVAYLRVISPGHKYPEPCVGRVLTHASVRGKGMGWAMMIEAIKGVARLFPQHFIRISAQQYLENFYGELGFRVVGEPYDDDGIMHVEMLLSSPNVERIAGMDDGS